MIYLYYNDSVIISQYFLQTFLTFFPKIYPPGIATAPEGWRAGAINRRRRSPCRRSYRERRSRWRQAAQQLERLPGVLPAIRSSAARAAAPGAAHDQQQQDSRTSCQPCRTRLYKLCNCRACYVFTLDNLIKTFIQLYYQGANKPKASSKPKQ